MNRSTTMSMDPFLLDPDTIAITRQCRYVYLQMDLITEERNTAQNEITKLQSKISKLEAEVVAKQNIITDVWSKRLNRAIERYSQAHMSRLARRIYTTLPRELRDFIYREVIVEDFGTELLQWSLSVLYKFPGLEEHVQGLPPRERFSEHWLVNPPFVGRDVATEAAEMFHSLANKTMLGNNFFEKKPTILHLKEFLSADVFGLGLRVGEHIRRLRLELHKSMLREHNTQKFKNNIDSLSVLCRHNRSLHLEIFFPKTNSLIDVVGLLVKLRTPLSQPNITSHITYERKLRDRASHGMITPIDLDHVVRLPMNCWKDAVVELTAGAGPLWFEERRWLTYREEKKGKDIWEKLDDGGIRMHLGGDTVWDYENLESCLLWDDQ